jgi:hypothetical protein
MSRPSRCQLHIWLSDDDRSFLKTFAADHQQSVGNVIRSLVRRLRRTVVATRDTAGSPPPDSLTDNVVPDRYQCVDSVRHRSYNGVMSKR